LTNQGFWGRAAKKPPYRERWVGDAQPVEGQYVEPFIILLRMLAGCPLIKGPAFPEDLWQL